MKQLPIHNPIYVALYEDFQKATAIQGYNTADWCTAPTREFLFFLETKDMFNIKEVKAPHIIAYYEYIRERPNQMTDGLLGEKAIRQHIYSVCLFFDYLVVMGHVANSPARLPKFMMGGSKEQEVLTKEEVMELYSCTNNRLVIAILGLAYGCGLRFSEMRNLDVSNVLFHKGVVNVKGKNNKSRTVPMSEGVMRDLKEYLVYERHKRVNPNCPTGAFILNKNGGRLGGATINGHYLKSLARKTGNKEIIRKGVHLHALRHAIATHLVEGGAPIDFVKRFLGHSFLDTTILYCKKRKLQKLHELHKRQQSI